VRTLNALIAGLAIQLGQIAEKKQSGELPAGDAPAAAAPPEAEAAPDTPSDNE
jgi:large subunit ribosomal protein L10